MRFHFFISVGNQIGTFVNLAREGAEGLRSKTLFEIPSRGGRLDWNIREPRPRRSIRHPVSWWETGLEHS